MANKASVVKVPSILVKKGSTLKLLKNNIPKNDLLMRCIKLGAVTKDQIIYKSVPGDFLRGEFPGLTLVSRSNVFNQTSTTVAKYINNDGKGTEIEKNSQEVIKVIGQNNYDTVFSALCSVISQELRIRALLALLTVEGRKKSKEVSVQTEVSYADSSCQTDETSRNILDHFKRRKRVRQQFRPYVVKEDNKKLKKLVINPKCVVPNLPGPTPLNDSTSSDNIISSTDTTKTVLKIEKNNDEIESFPELSTIVNEDSNFSDISTGNISLSSQLSVNIPHLLENPNLLFNNVDDHTVGLNTVPLTLLDGSVILVRAKPMDKFHWAAPDILKDLSEADKNKLMHQQAFIHWKYCLERDDDGYLPIHHAVMTNDIDFVHWQCAALRKKYGSVDILANGNMTALQMSIFKEGERCTALLLENGADPCLQDDEGKSFFHTAAEVSHQHLALALHHCRKHARTMLKEDEELWKPMMELQTDEQLAKVLLDHVCISCDNQGYTPLMLASKQGNHGAARLLLAASPATVNRPAPNSGSTALYLAVEAACIEASYSTNQTKISEKFLKTIEVLMEGGGDPGLENHCGSSVNVLLTEFNFVELSVLIANKLTSVRYFDGKSFAAGNINSMMLFKNSDGKVDLTAIRTKKANEDRNESSSPSTSTSSGSKTNNDSKVGGKISTGRVSKNKDKASNIEIKEIKTIKAKGDVARAASAAPLPPLPLPAVKVKASHFIIVPKNTKPSVDLPKYVKILPKVEKVTEDVKDKVDVEQGATDNATHKIKGKTGTARKNKTSAGCEQTPGKRQRKDRPSLKNKIIESIDNLGGEKASKSET